MTINIKNSPYFQRLVQDHVKRQFHIDKLDGDKLKQEEVMETEGPKNFAQRIDEIAKSAGEPEIDPFEKASDQIRYTSGVDPLGMQLPTTQNLTVPQKIAEQGAVTEVNRARFRAAMGGNEELEEFNTFLNEEDSYQYKSERSLNYIFEALSAGNYGTTRALNEIWNGTDTLMALKMGAKEAGDALGLIDYDDAQKMDFQKVFNKNGIQGLSGLAFALDVVVDPTNLIPGVMIAKGLGKAGKGLLKASGPLGEGFNTIFRPQAAIEDIGKAGVDYLRQRDYIEAGIKKDYFGLVRIVDDITGKMTPTERIMYGTWADQPKKLKEEVRKLVNQGAIPESRLELIDGNIDAIKKYTDTLFNTEAELGLLDKVVYRDNYLPGYFAFDPAMQKGQAKFAAKEAIPTKGEKIGFAQKRKTANQEERLNNVLDGKLASTELDIDNLLKRRGFDHARWVATKKLDDAVFNNPNISIPVGEEIVANADKLTKLKKELVEAGGDKVVIEVKQKTKVKTDTGEEIFKDKVIGAHVVPKEIGDHMARGDAALKDSGKLVEFFDMTEKLTSPWRGWATLSLGYHARNYIGMVFTNWVRGVGAKQVEIPLDKIGLATKSKKYELPSAGTGLIYRHLQAALVQTHLMGAGELPLSVGLKYNKLAKSIGLKGFNMVKMPELKLPGMEKKARVTVAQLGELAQQFDVPQSIPIHMGKTTQSKLLDLENPNSASDLIDFSWKNAEKTVSIDKLNDIDNLDKASLQALEMSNQASSTVGQKLNKVFGSDNPMIKANRALATVPENNGRLALFIDRLVKGDTLEDAAQETKKWHFDYRKLSIVEKKVFAAAMPFYAWTRFALPRMAMAVIEQPGRISTVPKFKRFMENWAENNDIPTDLETQDYFDEVQAVQMPWMDEDGYPVFGSIDLPLLELNRANPRDWLSSINPALKILYEGTTGESLFTGTDIERFAGEEEKDIRWLPKSLTDKLNMEPTGKIGRMTRSVLGNIIPPLDKFLWARQKYERDETRPDRTNYFWGRELGPKFTPLDLRKVLRGKNFQNVERARDFAKIKKQEIDKALED